MSNLTKERLEEYAQDGWDAAATDVEAMARELLSMRSAGDEEVRESTTTSLNQRLSQAFDAGNAVEFSIAAADAVVYAETIEQTNERLHNRNKAQGARIKELEPELNSLSNQLRDAQAEIERLKACGFAAPEGTTIQSLQSQIATLTAERDEARKCIKRVREPLSQYAGDFPEFEALSTSQRYWATGEIVAVVVSKCDSLTAELASLKSSPGMAEIDALDVFASANEDQSRTKQACNIARRSIASREEVVGLLKWIVEADALSVELKEYAENEACKDQNKARRIIEIVEGK